MSNRPSDFFGASPKSVLSKPFMHVQDQKVTGVAAGSSVSGWQTRVLNTVLHNDISGASLASNQVTLPAGEYYIECIVPAVRTDTNTVNIVDTSDSSTLLKGDNVQIPAATTITGKVHLSGVISLAVSKTIAVSHYSLTAQATYGLGSATSVAPYEVYADLKIWQLDRSLEIAPKAVNSGLQTVPSLDTTGNIMGFDISKTGANEVTITKGSCLDSTLDIPMALTVDTALAIPAVANTIYHVFLVRLVADGSFGVKAYTTEAGVASDALVDRWRWIGFWRTNGATECVVATMRGDYILFGKASENVVSSGITATPATVDHSAFIPESRVELIEYGARDAATSTVIFAQDSGTNTSFVAGASLGSSTADNHRDIWGNSLHQKSSMKPYLATRTFASGSGTVDLLIHAVKLRR